MSSKSLSQLHLPENITIRGVFENVKKLCFSIITSQVSNHYYLYLNVIVLKNNGKSHEIFQM